MGNHKDSLNKLQLRDKVKTEKRKEEYYRNDGWDVYDKKQYKYGLFAKRGYKCLKIFKTKEEADAHLKKYNLECTMEIRKIIGW